MVRVAQNGDFLLIRFHTRKLELSKASRSEVVNGLDAWQLRAAVQPLQSGEPPAIIHEGLGQKVAWTDQMAINDLPVKE